MSNHYLNPLQIENYKTKIEKNMEDAKQLTKAAYHEAISDNEKTSDASDQGTQFEKQNTKIALGNHSNIAIIAMKKALEEFDPEFYGYCEECGVEIGVGRLDINPSVDKCCECQGIEEQKARNFMKL